MPRSVRLTHVVIDSRWVRKGVALLTLYIANHLVNHIV